jgi:hypothetical protein
MTEVGRPVLFLFGIECKDEDHALIDVNVHIVFAILPGSSSDPEHLSRGVGNLMHITAYGSCNQ